MRHLSTNRKICAAGALILLACVGVGLTPWYRSYLADEHARTCAKIRAAIEWKYADILDGGESDAAMGSEELIHEAVAAYCGSDVALVPDEDGEEGHLYQAQGICRDGGTLHITLNAAGYVFVVCDAPGHDQVYYD